MRKRRKKRGLKHVALKHAPHVAHFAKEAGLAGLKQGVIAAIALVVMVGFKKAAPTVTQAGLVLSGL